MLTALVTLCEAYETLDMRGRFISRIVLKLPRLSCVGQIRLCRESVEDGAACSPEINLIEL